MDCDQSFNLCKLVSRTYTGLPLQKEQSCKEAKMLCSAGSNFSASLKNAAIHVCFSRYPEYIYAAIKQRLNLDYANQKKTEYHQN